MNGNRQYQQSFNKLSVGMREREESTDSRFLAGAFVGLMSLYEL